MLTSGQLLADRYRLDHRIAVGGMGEVWQAVDVRLDRTVAIKILKPELCGDAEFLHRFRTEARTTASLNHPGIAAVHDYGETAAVDDSADDTAYLVMELVEGEPLASILAREGRVRAEHTLDMLEQAGHALQAAHERGLVHRDVKPGNILISPNGTVKLTDFGIAKAVDAAPVTRSGMVMGTAHYIAPEQALGGEATPSSDVYSLAVVGYECLMGHRPFLSDNAVTVAMMHIREMPTPLPPDVPPGARAVIDATLVKDPRRRYGAGGEFARAVASVRAGMPLPTPAALTTAAQQRPRTPPGGPNTGRHPLPAGSAPEPASAPSASTHPPGVIPVQPAAGQNARNRTGVWILLAVVLVIMLAILGWVLLRSITLGAAPEHSGFPSSASPATTTLDSPVRMGHTALRPSTAPGGQVTNDGPIRTNAPERRTRQGNQIGESARDTVFPAQRQPQSC